MCNKQSHTTLRDQYTPKQPKYVVGNVHCTRPAGAESCIVRRFFLTQGLPRRQSSCLHLQQARGCGECLQYCWFQSARGCGGGPAPRGPCACPHVVLALQKRRIVCAACQSFPHSDAVEALLHKPYSERGAQVAPAAQIPDHLLAHGTEGLTRVVAATLRRVAYL